MKICTKCNLAKDPSEYFFRDKKNGRLHSQCKECYIISRRASYAKHYYRQREHYLKRAKNRNARLRREYQKEIYNFSSRKTGLQLGCNI